MIVIMFSVRQSCFNAPMLEVKLYKRVIKLLRVYNDHKCFEMLEQLMRFKCKNEFGGIRIWWIWLSFYAPNETHQPTYRFGDSCNYCVLIRGIWFSQALIKSGKLDSRGSFHHISATQFKRLIPFWYAYYMKI